MRGTYALLIEAEQKVHVQIGKLGKFRFPQGLYIYIGSAKNNLEKRIERHLKKEKKLFWHIDYLLQAPCVRIKKVWAGAEGEECSLAAAMASGSAFQIPAPGFGSSDCRCKTHLFSIVQTGKEATFLRQHKFSLLDPPIESDTL